MNAVPDFLLSASRRELDDGMAIHHPMTGQPDAELILACSQFIDIERQIRSLYDGPDAIEDDDAADVAVCHLEGPMDALLSRLEQMRATTPIGIQARAAALAAHNSNFVFSFDDRETVSGRLLDWLMRDALALGAGPADRA